MAATDRRADAVRYFLRDCVGVPRVVVGLMRFMPVWPKLKAVAHTLPYDARIVGDLGRGRAAARRALVQASPVPALVVAGGKSPAWMKNGMRALADGAAKRAVPDACRSDARGQARPPGTGPERVLHALTPAATACDGRSMHPREPLRQIADRWLRDDHRKAP